MPRRTSHLLAQSAIFSPHFKTSEKMSERIPMTLEGCARELDRLGELQRRHAREIERASERQQIVTARMQDIIHGRPVSDEKSSEKDVFVKIGEVAYNAQLNTLRKPRPSRLGWLGDLDIPDFEPSLEEGTSSGLKSTAHPVQPHYHNKTRSDLFEPGVKMKSIRFFWDRVKLQSTLFEDVCTSPLITALKKLEWQYRDFQHIERWCKTLSRLFYASDENDSGSIGQEEFSRMIDQLPLSEELQESLREQFHDIDLDKTGMINLREFLYFFMQYEPFRMELCGDLQTNEPYIGKHNLSSLQKTRQWAYNVITRPNFNSCAQGLYALDMCATLVALITLFAQAVYPSTSKLIWAEDLYLWIFSIFFGVQYILGLLLCKSKGAFVTNNYHIFELISFLPFLVYAGSGYTGTDLCLSGFMLFRIWRIFHLASIFPTKFGALETNIDIYVSTVSLAYTSYRGMAFFMLGVCLFSSTLVYAFERGVYNEDLGTWIRPGEYEESPFANFFNCVYFTIVTGTTLGYGDMYPITYVGKILAMVIVLIGLVNLTFVINTIGDCFEEVFRNFLQNRTREIEEERSEFIRQNVSQAQKNLEAKRKRSRISAPIINLIPKRPRIGPKLSKENCVN